MPTANKFNDFVEQKNLGKHIFDGSTHVFKIALTDTIPVNTNTILSNITQITAANGYTSGGNATTITESETSGTMTVQGTQVTFTASGGAIAQFQYYVLYNDTQTSPNKPLVMWWDHGSKVNLADGESFVIKFNNASPGTIFTDT